MIKFRDMMEVEKFWLLVLLLCILTDILWKNWDAALAWTACTCWMLDGVGKDIKIRNTVKSLDDLKQTVKEMRV